MRSPRFSTAAPGVLPRALHDRRHGRDERCPGGAGPDPTFFRPWTHSPRSRSP